MPHSQRHYRPSRRRFLASGLVASAAGIPGSSFAAMPDRHSNPIVVFAKHVQALPLDELAKRLKRIGVQGIEATLRRGGQIEPDELTAKLGPFCETLSKQDQRAVIAASDINFVNQKSEAYLGALGKHHIPYMRMAYYRYDFKRPLLPQLDAFAKQATELSQLCRASKVCALYQNHAGKNYVGAALWDLHQVLADVDPEYFRVAVDIRHTSLELSQSFEAGYRGIRGFQGATYVKDFDWVDGKPQNVPLGSGRAKRLFDLIKADGFVGPLSLHMEYTDHRDASQVEASWTAIADDVRTLKEWLT